MALNKSYLTRLGLRTGWAFGENMYRGDDEYSRGLLNTLRILARSHLSLVTEYALPNPTRHFPPNFDINAWLLNEKQYPMPYQLIRTAQGGQLIVVDPLAAPPVPFPPPGGTPDPEVFSTGYEEGKWVYDATEWAVIGLVTTSQPPMKGRLVFSKVDNSFEFWDGTQWRIFNVMPERSFEVTAHYAKSLLGGRLFTYCAVENFTIPNGFVGSTGSGKAKGNVTLQVRRNDDVIGTCTIPADPTLRAYFSGGNVAYAPGDRLSLYADGNTNGLKDVSVTIRGIYN